MPLPENHGSSHGLDSGFTSRGLENPSVTGGLDKRLIISGHGQQLVASEHPLYEPRDCIPVTVFAVGRISPHERKITSLQGFPIDDQSPGHDIGDPQDSSRATYLHIELPESGEHSKASILQEPTPPATLIPWAAVAIDRQVPKARVLRQPTLRDKAIELFKRISGSEMAK